jgi:hypothetical protein
MTEQRSTREFDALRLHLLCVHGDELAPSRMDQEAEALHFRSHHYGLQDVEDHPVDARTWDTGMIANRLDGTHGPRREYLAQTVRDVIARHITGQPLPHDRQACA